MSSKDQSNNNNNNPIIDEQEAISRLFKSMIQKVDTTKIKNILLGNISPYCVYPYNSGDNNVTG